MSDLLIAECDDAAEYGKHSLFSHERPVTDVRDLIADHYVGRHRREGRTK